MFFCFFGESLSGFKIFGKDFEDEANAWWGFLNRKSEFQRIEDVQHTHTQAWFRLHFICCSITE